MLPSIAPISVPTAQPMYGRVESPAKKLLLTESSWLATAKISSVIIKPSIHLEIPLNLESAFCPTEIDIKEYLILIVICEISIWKYCPGCIIIPMPANCPADVTVVIEMSTACHQDSPYDTAIIPKVNETDRYPSAIGIPAVSPRL